MNAELDISTELAEIWAELLGLAPDEVPRDTGFLNLGGDSVLAVRMSAVVRRKLGVALALSDVRVEITLAELADLITRRSAGAAGGRALPVEVVRRTDPAAPFPLLPLQQGYFVGQQDGWELSYDSAHHYVDIGLTEVDADEAPEALQDALRRLVRHQPTLRARVLPDGRQHLLAADDADAVPTLQVIDLRDAPEAEAKATVAAIRSQMSTNGPDPTYGPGVEMRLTLLPDDRARLHTAVSLLIIDGWSSNVFYRDLFGLVADWNAVLPPLEVDYGDYVESVSDLSDTDAWDADRDWWWDRLDSFPLPPALPLVADPREVRPDLMGTRQTTVDVETWAAFRTQCTAHGVTPSAAMFTAYAIVLARQAGHRRMLLNSLQLNRLPLHPDVHRIVGAFASTMLIPVELAADATFAELAADSQRQFSESAAHNLISGVEVARELGRRRGTHRPVAPIVFQSTLGMDAAMGERVPETAGPMGRIDMADHHQQLRTPQVALEVRMFELRDEMFLVFSLVDELFDTSVVDGMFHELTGIARTLAEPESWDASVALPSELDAPEPEPAEHLRVGRYERQDRTEELGPPRTDLERTIAAVWEDMLGVSGVDRADDFFALGGDSLLAVRVLGKLARESGITVAVRDFLDAPTISGLAALTAPER
ncbi:condensation domain-containing protein [Saccharopolyspora sp. K220]|uniref:condensation domain-containing protein n=1 Tax=Saccharopolyspora soli TaxID=2926618 RepID=UPI001F5A8B7A|nr:condensation domain-containing protein [Saccharopolyspora soli]MCI2419794.1 condensation domain-containing protein [Saccharopolyspora soli]